MSAERNSTARLWHAAGQAALIFVGSVVLLALAGCGGSASTLSSPGASTTAAAAFPAGPATGTIPLQVRVGDNPASSQGQIVAFELSVSSIQAQNGAGDWIQLLGPGSVELTHTASVTMPVAAGGAPSDTYDQLVMSYTGARVTYLDASGLPVTANLALPQPTQTINLGVAPIVIGASPSIVNINVDVAKTVTLTGAGAPSMVMPVIAVSQVGVASTNPQPETGLVPHVTGTVTSADAVANTVTVSLGLPGSSLTFSTAGAVLENLDLNQAANELVDITGSTQNDGTLLATDVSAVDAGASGVSGAAMEGVLAGYNASGTMYAIVQDPNGANDASPADPSQTSGLTGKKVSVDLSAADFSIDADGIDMTGVTAVFDASHVFPGQQVELESASAITLTDPDGNAAFLLPHLARLQPQTISGRVANYTAGGGGTATFDLLLPDATSYLRLLNPAAAVQVYQQANTNLNGTATLANGMNVQVRGLLFCTDSSDVLQQGTHFVMVAARVAKGN